MAASGGDFQDRIKLESRELLRLIDDVRAQRSAEHGTDRRRFCRVPLPGRLQIKLAVVQGETVGRFIARPLDLSRTGIGLLHGGFVYDGSEVAVDIPTVTGSSVKRFGRVVRCQHVGRGVHEVGVRFEQPISMVDVLGPTFAAADNELAVPAEGVEFVYGEDDACATPAALKELAELGGVLVAAAGAETPDHDAVFAAARRIADLYADMTPPSVPLDAVVSEDGCETEEIVDGSEAA